MADKCSKPAYRRLIVSALLAVAAFLGGCDEKNDVVVLKLAHSVDVSHPVHKAMVFMGQRLEEISDGKITLEIFPNEQLGSERETIEQVQLGIIDITKTSTAPLESFIPKMGVFSIPYVFRGYDHFWNVLEGPIGDEVKQGGTAVKLYGLCFYDSGSRSFYTTSNPINSPADLKGLKVRVQQSNTAIEMVKALGGSPTPISYGELYTSLQQGVVDGAENNPPSFETSRHYEVCKYYSLDEHTMVPDIIIINSDFWDGLTDKQRQIIQEAADESSIYQRKLWKEKTQESLRIVKAAGVEIIHPDKTPFIKAVKDMHESYKGTEVGELLARIKEAK
ncbi:MAG: C4-dicarboxylate ABC transporter substrate-binding protein [Planctomycetales bacterium 4572_13]|nr:MAG: C4-dicarboxylate ABC transporter substrate-binding protein [Planctomycetales bacterium 4572_13]